MHENTFEFEERELADEAYSEAMHRLMTRAVVPLDDVATLLEISLNSARKAAAAGEIELFEIGCLKKAVSEPLRRRLGITRPLQQFGAATPQPVEARAA